MLRVGWWMVLAVGIGLPIWAMAQEQSPSAQPKCQIQIFSPDGKGAGAVFGSAGAGGSFGAGGGVQAGGVAGAATFGQPEGKVRVHAHFSNPPSQYWVGVECTPVDPTLRSQLQLSEGQGLVVRSVVPDSPAAKAGLREHDILLQAGDKKLGSVKDLIEAVEAAKEQKLSLEIIREGKRQKVEVTPTKRPPEQMMPGFGWGMGMPDLRHPDYEAMRKWIEKLMQQGQPLRFRFFQPGFVVPPGWGWYFGWGSLPEGMSIAISKTGKEPAQIKVQKDGKTWEVTEKELDKLPPDVRPHVERMLGRGGLIDMDFQWEVGPPWFVPESKERRLPDRIRQDLQKQLEKHQQEMEKLQKQLDELRKSLEKLGPEAAPKELKKRSVKEPPKEKV
ncbi:MAG: PDZ domain-containing protein [Thermoguttaceae bacterium]|nr:PDZ domain-containing protein [Thermoguttaceae bacterium]MDW8039652.1 site-2 protease family protein [Thermoguttaceae bacterium]